MRVHLRVEPGKPKTHCGLTSAHMVLKTSDPAQASCHKCFDIAKRKGLVTPKPVQPVVLDAAAEADYAQRSNDRAGVNDPAILDALLKGGQQ